MVQFGEVSFSGAELGPVTLPAFAFGPFGFGVWEIGRVGGETLGPVGLAGAAGAGAWLEWWLLRRRLAPTIGAVRPPPGDVIRMLAAAGVGAAAARGAALLLPASSYVLGAVVVLGVFGGLYLVLTRLLGLEEARAFATRLQGLLGRR